MAHRNKLCPLFDTLEAIQELTAPAFLTDAQKRDYQQACHFLLSYQNISATFLTYRREIERLLQWCQCKADKTLKQLCREDMEAYIKFCQKPTKTWISLKKVPRFMNKDGHRVPNTDWRPFVATLPKAQISQGKKPDVENYTFSEKSLREIFTICSSFFNFLLQENYLQVNPIAQMRQKNRFFTQQHTKKIIRKLSELQWGYVIETAYLMADENAKYERTLFIMNALYGMYLRISELAASKRWLPKMGDFQRDSDGLWWFTTVGKGNKQRQIAVSPAMLNALKRWRKHLNLSPLPSLGETSPLIPKHIGVGSITSTRPIRVLVQECFDHAVARLEKDGFKEEAQQLMHATVHWLRHTGISEDVKIRPREHVRDDAGHSSSAITDKYIDVELRERASSARKKQIIPESVMENIDHK